jgi:hypothetical protein
MARYLIQSASTFKFLHVSPVSGDVDWTPSLLTAMQFGLVDDEEQVAQLIEDHFDRGSAITIDLDEGGQ